MSFGRDKSFGATARNGWKQAGKDPDGGFGKRKAGKSRTSSTNYGGKHEKSGNGLFNNKNQGK